MAEVQQTLLPHEVTLIKERIARLSDQQALHGVLLGEAMSQGAETFHDNAPAEIVRDDQEVLIQRALPLLRLLKNYIIVEYPQDDYEGAALGSRATIAINEGEPFTVDIVGFRSSRDDDIEQVTLESPLGGALRGRRAGEIFMVELGSNTVNVEVKNVDQVSQRAEYPDYAKD